MGRSVGGFNNQLVSFDGTFLYIFIENSEQLFLSYGL